MIISQLDSEVARLDAPFRLTTSRDLIVDHSRWRKALRQVLAALDRDARVIVVLGAPGTGKTLLLREIAHSFNARGIKARQFDRGNDSSNLLRVTVAERVILIDEADGMSLDTFDRLLRQVSPICILAALPAFAKRFPASSESTAAGLAAVHLERLPADEVGGFLASTLIQANRVSNGFTSAAVGHLSEVSEGIPRVLKMLAGTALFMAELDHIDIVTEQYTRIAVALRDGDALPEHPWPAPHQVTEPTIKARDETLHAITVEQSSNDALIVTPIKMGNHARLLHIGLVLAFCLIISIVPLLWPTLSTDRQVVDQPTAAADPPASANIKASPLQVSPLEAPTSPSPAPDEPTHVASVVIPTQRMEIVAAEPSSLIAKGGQVGEGDPAEQDVRTGLPANAEPSPPQSAAAVLSVQLPNGPITRVQLEYIRGDGSTDRRVTRLRDILRGEGIEVGNVTSISLSARPGIRFFYAEDAAAAMAVRAALLKVRVSLPELLNEPELVTPGSSASFKGSRPGTIFLSLSLKQ